MPAGIAIDGDLVWVVDQANHRIQAFDRAGRVQGVLQPELKPGDGLKYPWGLALSGAGGLLVSDWGNNRLVEITVSGSAQCFAQMVRRPAGVSVAPDGLVAVADWGNDCIRLFRDYQLCQTLTGAAVTTTWSAAYHAEKTEVAALRQLATGWLPHVEAKLARPSGVELTADGSLFIADTGRHRVQLYGID